MYKTHTLSNGLTIIGEEIPYLKSITLGVWVNAGSRIENEELGGISHFIEHMLFKGTKNRTSKEIASTIDNLGGQINAFTSKECTCYYVKLLDEHIDIGIDILSDMFLNPLFDEKDIDKERQVIIEELKMYEDSPEDLVYDLLMEGIYKTDALGMNIIGTEESLYNMNRNTIKDYFNKYYVASNSVISISGNFKFEEMVKLIESKFKDLAMGNVDIKITEPEFHPCFIARNKDTEQVNLAISLKAIPLEYREDAYALSIINNIFGGSISSRLFQNIRENKGLVYSIYSAPSLYRKSGELGIYASMSNENLKKVYNLVLEEIDNLRQNHLTDKEIKESKEQLKGSYILGLESTSSRMMSIGKAMVLTKKVKNPNDIIESINNIDKARIDLIIDKVFNRENIGVCIVGRDVEGITLD
ncbi:M16 family metallopeptidase [Paraclostridium bifermentans]|uniref:Insulinase family protein n=1 Tax=Paraclostridium bifermentans TaxID=1490 RepID=A0A5P3XER2_PARBF|nr:pitrilysin family protein [Paraclostridium bifermentans]MCU9808072.1 insulinase family protein [Paraclostridium sp. AKS46]EQK47443.1 peptidase M16 inactive domain protein [[Clostridium] bifermentans ATCC 19299] [Paraclostridium bifermentans ATCC 19299]MBN8046517.1 insulinase family protein [Paraclostridium bifermentans]MCR1875061.1 insulinase family protein [Paraclostridium bifermentans]NME09414.1 insulinase family protein [Paraclostridium bifermentans]